MKIDYKRIIKIIIFCIIIGLIIIGGYLVNRYVIPRVEYSIDNKAESKLFEKSEISDNTYKSKEVEVNIEKIEKGEARDKITYYVADIRLQNPDRITRAFANDQFGANIVEDMNQLSERNNAIISVNADYYAYRGNGIIVNDSKVYRDEPAREGVAIYKDGTMKIYDERETNGEELVNEGVKSTLSFGPVLLKDGETVADYQAYAVDSDNFIRGNIAGEHPRTGIGYYDKNHFCFIAVDGREEGYSKGVTLNGFAEIFKELGCQLAYNLDGGDSTHMCFMGKPVNKASKANGFERKVSDIIYIY